MNVMNWESKRKDSLYGQDFVMLMEVVYMLSWDRIGSLWFWLSNCLVLHSYFERDFDLDVCEP